MENGISWPHLNPLQPRRKYSPRPCMMERHCGAQRMPSFYLQKINCRLELSTLIKILGHAEEKTQPKPDQTITNDHILFLRIKTKTTKIWWLLSNLNTSYFIENLKRRNGIYINIMTWKKTSRIKSVWYRITMGNHSDIFVLQISCAKNPKLELQKVVQGVLIKV